MDNSSRHAAVPSPVLNGTEKLVGVGFRCWMAGYQTGDIACWEHAWNLYASELGTNQARAVVTDLSCWVRKIRDLSSREIQTYPTSCRKFCRDECVAVAMVAASQNNVCPALRSCTYALLGCANIDGALKETEMLAATLAANECRLSPSILAWAIDGLTPATLARH